MTEQQSPASQFTIQRIYVKDLSFESPRTPDIFRGGWQPEIKLEMNTQHRAIEGDLYEVILAITLTAEMEAKNVFLVEIQQAGIFQVQFPTEQETARILGSFCPNILFPYAREVADSLVVKGGFPPLMLAPVNFDALYQQSLQQRAGQAV